ncbi:F-box/RNI/FBD-like domain protein, partial [Trifolium medium]|nr:F-box/RNI/FBD-like domain protein [Trifolium medium]
DATTILSKRWKHIWRSVTTLRIDRKIKNLNSNTDFINFVHSVLLSRHPTLPIKTFHLQFTYNYPHESPSKNLTNWVNFVVQRGVECLDLDVTSERLAKFPITVLTCKTLVVLKLSSFRVEKDLRTYHVDFDPRESLTCNEWKGFLLSNLFRADINCYGCYFPLKAVQNAPSLRLIYRQQRYYHNDLIPTFYNLTQLELLCYDYSKEFILDVLNHCPKLQRLDLTEIGYYHAYARKNDKTNWIFPDVAPLQRSTW